MSKDIGSGAEPRWLNKQEATAWRALLAIVHRGFPEVERDLRTNHDMLSVHYRLFVTLSAAPGASMRLSDLALASDLSQSRLTHRLRVLIDRGEVEVTQDPDDGRAKRASLTEAGLERLRRTAPAHVETVRRVIFDHLTPAQTEAIAEALTPVAEALSEHPEYLNPRDCQP